MSQNLDPLRWCKLFAVTKHGNQTYSGALPYSHHLASVEAVLRRFGFGKTDWCEIHGNRGPCETCFSLLEAAWLHDVMEDTGTKKKEIAEFFGDDVADLVEAVTNEPGPSRKVRAALTYPKIRKAGQNAVILKLADRIANVENGGKLVDMYRQEYEDFRRALYTEPRRERIATAAAFQGATYIAMWAHLDNLMKEKP